MRPIPKSLRCHRAAAAVVKNSSPESHGGRLYSPIPACSPATDFSLLELHLECRRARVPISVRMLQRRNKFDTAPRPRAPSPELGAAGSAVASLAAAVEALQHATFFGPAPPLTKRSDAGDAVIWIFRNVFVSSPALAVALLGLVSQFLRMSVEREVVRAETLAKIEATENEPSPDSPPPQAELQPPPPPPFEQFSFPASLVVRKNGTEAVAVRKMYESMVADGRAGSLVLSNYAQFLYEHDDIERAEQCFEKAVLMDPEDGETLRRYAMFLWQERGDVERAEELFQEAMKAEPRCDYHQSCYAWFLWMTGGDGTCLPE